MVEQQRGFTLVETVVAIVLVALVATTVVLMYTSIQRIQTAALFRESATMGAQRQIEKLRSQSFGSLTDGTLDVTNDLPTVLPESKRGTIVISEVDGELKRVDVTVSYDLYGSTENVALTSYIGMSGITQ